jgi:rhamnosyltransferase
LAAMALTERHRPPWPGSGPGAAANSTEAARPSSVLVLLATYNGSRWIREQMESILAQEGIDLAIAVRDDASTDGTRWELARFENDERVRIAAATAASGSAARNFLTLIRENAADPFDFVAFADQDDLWNPDKLSRACSMLIAGGSAGYSSATVATWEDGRERVMKLSGAPTASDFLFEGAGQGCTFVLAADFYERVRHFLATQGELTDGIHYHDWLVYALARSWGMRWSFDPVPSVLYRQHSANDTGARHTLAGIAKRFSLIRQGWYRGQLSAIARLCLAAAPASPAVRAWNSILLQSDSFRKRLRIARFCLDGGRKKSLDNAVILFSALAGWI